MNTFSEIKNDIKTKNFSPIYLLMGEEEFYIDNITNLFIDHVLSEEEKQFNLNVLYGKESSVDQIISICKKYPLNSKYQIVLVQTILKTHLIQQF